jgi:snRNA-activating protein complex subunit 3
MHEVTFQALEIRLQQPYWLCHAGDCEHFFVIESIRSVVLYCVIDCLSQTAAYRAHHPSDPPLEKFPLTTQITPRLLDTCRACNKAPAVYSIIGDIRLGESPFVICKPCWRWMVPLKGESLEKVQVVPLPKHEFGWHG